MKTTLAPVCLVLAALTSAAWALPAGATEPPAAIQWGADLRFRGLSGDGVDPLTSLPIESYRVVYQRLRLEAKLKKGPLTADFQVQVSGSFGANGPGEPPAPVGLQVGKVSYRPTSVPTLRLDVGRMALNYGAGRHISDYDFHREGNAYDGLRLRFEPSAWLQVDGFAVQLRRNTAQPDNERNLLGIYGTGQPVQGLTTELYLLALRDRSQQDRSEFRTVGARVRWDRLRWLWLEAEGALQIGEVKVTDTKAGKTHSATSFSAELGASGHLGLPMSFVIFGDRYSAEDTNADDVSRGWRPLYPDMYRHIGLQRLFQLTGVSIAGARWEAAAHASVKARLAVRALFTEQSDDLPGLGGGPIVAKDEGLQALGVEADLRVDWTVFPGSTVSVAYGLFVPDEAVALRFEVERPSLLLLQWRSVL